MPSTTIYLGAPGCGKSTLMRSHVEALTGVEGAPLFFIVDHGEVPGRPSWRDLPGARIYTTSADWWADPGPIAVFAGPSGQEVAALAIEVGWSVYVDDEVDGAVQDGWKDSPLREIVKRGRHLPNRAGRMTEISALIATHRPANLPTDIVGLFDRAYIGRLTSAGDAERIYREGWLPGNAREIQEYMTGREPGEFVVWPE